MKKERAKQRAELVKAWKLLDVLEQGMLHVITHLSQRIVRKNRMLICFGMPSDLNYTGV